MGCEHWVPSCHQHLCSEHFTPSCFQWRWGVRYLRPDSVPSIFSQSPPAKRQQSARSNKKPGVLPLPQEATLLSLGPDVTEPGPVHLVVLGPASRDPEAGATMILTPLVISPTPIGPCPGSPTQHPRERLGLELRALQQRVRRLQRRQKQHQAQLQALEELAQQLHRGSLPCRFTGPEESQVFTIICAEPDIAVVLAQGPAPPTLDARPELQDSPTPSA